MNGSRILAEQMSAENFRRDHDLMAQMLGVRRATVSETAQGLQQAGMIQYQRGRLTVVGRHRLAQGSCGCYPIVRDEFDRLRGPLPHFASAPA